MFETGICFGEITSLVRLLLCSYPNILHDEAGLCQESLTTCPGIKSQKE